MRKLLLLFLAVTVFLSLAACEKKEEAPSGDNNTSVISQNDNGDSNANSESKQPSESNTFKAALLDKLGLAGIVPDNATTKKTDSDLPDFYMGSYSFVVSVNGDADIERMEYANKVLSTIQSISDDGKAYQDVYTADFQGWIIAKAFTEGVPSNQLPGYYFYKDGNVITCNVYDYGNGTDHNYQIDIGKEADDYIKYKEN